MASIIPYNRQPTFGFSSHCSSDVIFINIGLMQDPRSKGSTFRPQVAVDQCPKKMVKFHGFPVRIFPRKPIHWNILWLKNIMDSIASIAHPCFVLLNDFACGLVLQVNLWTSPEDETAMPKSNHHRQARGRQSKIVYRPDMWWQAFRAVPHRFSHGRSMKNNWIKLCPTKIVSKSSYTFCCTQFGFGWSIYVGYPTLQVYSQRNSQRGCPIFRPTLHRPDFPDSSLDESSFCLGKMSRSEAPKGRKYQADWCNVVKPKT